jgi:hypothetical protein
VDVFVYRKKQMSQSVKEKLTSCVAILEEVAQDIRCDGFDDFFFF